MSCVRSCACACAYACVPENDDEWWRECRDARSYDALVHRARPLPLCRARSYAPLHILIFRFFPLVLLAPAVISSSFLRFFFSVLWCASYLG